MLQNVAPELKAASRWLVWIGELLPNGKLTKIPYCVATRRKCDITDPSSWCDFHAAATAAEQNAHVIGGAGFSLGGGFVGTDLDRVLDASGVLDSKSQAIVDAFGSYTELSPSRTGLHVIAGGEFAGGLKYPGIELYGDKHFFTMTGEVYQERSAFNHNQATIDELAASIRHIRGDNTKLMSADWLAAGIDNDELWRKLMAEPEAYHLFTTGDLSKYDNDHSRADQALMNYITKHTPSASQAVQVFMASALGQRAKAQKRPAYVNKMASKGYDLKLPEIQIPTLASMMPALDIQPPDDEIDQTPPGGSVAECFQPQNWPGGMLGGIASFIYNNSKKHMEEAAIAAALALMAGICGRQYQCNGTGLNLYIMLLAETGSGKEAMSTGVGKLFDAVINIPPTSGVGGVPMGMGFEQFRGPADLTGKGLLLDFMKSGTLSFLSIFNEFATKMAQLSTPGNNQGDQALKRWLLDFFMKSGKGNSFAGAKTADNKNDITLIKSPALSILCESTPKRLYDALNFDIIGDGLLPRFTVFERTARSPRNPRHNIDPDTTLVAALRELMRSVIDAKVHDVFRDVAYTPEAWVLQDAYDEWCDERTYTSEDEGTKKLWNRANLKAQRMAALYAIGMVEWWLPAEHRRSPLITVEMVEWAKKVTTHEVTTLAGKFNRGEIGGEIKYKDEDMRREMLAACRHFMGRKMDFGASYKRFKRARDAGYIPHSYLLLKCATAVFRQDPRGQVNAIKSTIASLIETGNIKREQPIQDGSAVDLGGTVYRLVVDQD